MDGPSQGSASIDVCFFISAILPSSAHISVLVGVVDRYRRALKPQSNPALDAQLQPVSGSALGALERKAALLQRCRRSDERKEASLRRKGWGESRIQRWRNQQQNVSSGHDPQAGLIDWERLHTHILRQPRTPYVGLILHWHGGGFDEPIALQGRVFLPLCAESLGRVREDVLTLFRVAVKAGNCAPLLPPSL
jgi:hypothetical protein